MARLRRSLPILLPGLLSLATLASAGCLRHTATAAVQTPYPPANAMTGTDEKPVFGLVVEARIVPAATPIQRSGPLPQDIAITAWHREAGGAICRDDQLVRTGLPLWQRFPFDLFADAVPIQLAVERSAVLSPRPLAERDPAAISAEAAAAGYAQPPTR